MKYNKLGKTGIEVSALSFGGWSIISDFQWGEQDSSKSTSAVHAALDAGINFFDTAEAYGEGESEKLIGKALGSNRKDIIIASKVVPEKLKPADLKKACEDSLCRLKTDYIDLYQIHWPNHEVPISESLGALEDLKNEGKIRFSGISNFGPEDLTNLLEYGSAESNQLPYSLLWRGLEKDLLPLCLENQIGILCYSPLLHGLLTGKFLTAEKVPDQRARTRHFSSKRQFTRHGEEGAEEETFNALAGIRKVSSAMGQSMACVSLSWLINRPGVTSVIVGSRSPEQLRQNVNAAKLSLPEEIMEDLDRATSSLTDLFGSNLDMWESSKNSRIK